MIDHYNAFISYKHAPLDNKIAAHIQSALEHFHIPRKIQKQIGMKRIQRIFRDKDELPLSSDLSGTIAHALENSDYLIVICSKSTALSQWVPREIEFFLRNHTKEQIFTVLIEGEPQESIPPILCSDERMIRLSDGTEQLVHFDKEPLSCDYRMSVRKADKEELPRLASVLIGCSYDELVNRRRQYRIRKIAAFAAVIGALAIAFIGYLIFNQIRLKRAYDENLRSQSINLANQSMDLYQQDERVDALSLSLASVTSESQDRPITGEGVRALTDATGVYRPVSGSSFLPNWNYQMRAYIKDFCISPNAYTIAGYDVRGDIVVWDTTSHEEMMSITYTDDMIEGMEYLDDTSLLFWTNDTLYLYEVARGAEIWSAQFDYETFGSNLILSSDRSMIYLPSFSNLYCLSAKDGKLLEKYEIVPGGNFDLILCKEFAISPDESKMAFYKREYDSSSDTVGIIDLQTKEIQYIETEKSIIDLDWFDDSRILMSRSDEAGSTIISGNEYIFDTQSIDVALIDLNQSQEIWCTSFEASHFNSSSAFGCLSDLNCVVYYYANTLLVVDVDSGNVLDCANTNSSIMKVSRLTDYSFAVYTKDGGRGYFSIDDGLNSVVLFMEFADEISKMSINKDVYVSCNYRREIISYSMNNNDSDWEVINASIRSGSISSDYYMNEDYLVFNHSLEKQTLLTVYDVEKHEQLWEVRLDEKFEFVQVRILCIIDDELYYVVSNLDSGTNLYCVDAEDGSLVEEKKLLSGYCVIPNTMSVSGEVLTCISQAPDGLDKCISMMNLETRKEETFELPIDFAISNLAPKYFADSNQIYYSDTNEGDFVIDVSSGRIRRVPLPSNWFKTTVVANDGETGKWVICDQNQTLLVDEESSNVMKLNSSINQALGVMFFDPPKGDKQILVVYDDGTMCRYDLEDGSLIDSFNVTVYSYFFDTVTFRYVEEQHMILMQTGYVTDVIDAETWYEVALVENSLGYSEANDEFFTYAKNGSLYYIGTVPHYSVDELIEKAKEILGETEMSEEDKSRYGISDD